MKLLLNAYANGIFPMADARDDPEIFWVEPKNRAILPLDGLNISRSLAKVIKQDRFVVTVDQDFGSVIAACAASNSDRPDTWINAEIESAFQKLHELGYAHSVECWLDGKLVGGLYGLSIGRAFFGESMFSRVSNASKVALVWLVARLNLGGFKLLDCQFMTDHLATFGVVEISQARYLEYLRSALNAMPFTGQLVGGVAGVAGGAASADWAALDGALRSTAFSSPGKFILHCLTQTS